MHVVLDCGGDTVCPNTTVPAVSVNNAKGRAVRNTINNYSRCSTRRKQDPSTNARNNL
jgi:hypothetical protein